MVDLLDINVLVGAFRKDSSAYAITKPWLEEALARQQPVSFPPMVEVGFLRLVTNTRAFPNPSSLPEALNFLESLAASGCFLPTPWTPRIRKHTIKLAGDLETGADHMNDVALAAIAEVMNWRLVSWDKGFARFPKLQWLNLARLRNA